MKKEKLKVKMIALLTCLLVVFGMSTTVFAEDLRLGVTPAVVRVDMTSKDSTTFDLTIIQSAEVKESEVNLSLDYDVDLIKDYEQPVISLDCNRAVLKQNAPLKVKGTVQMPKDRLDREYEVDVIVSVNTGDNIVGTLRVPILIKNGVIKDQSIEYKGTKVVSTTGDGKHVLYKDYFNLVKSLFSFNKGTINKSWNTIKYKTYTKETKKGVKADVGSSETVRLADLIVKNENDINIDKYVLISEEPLHTDFLSSIQVEEDKIILGVGDKKYTMQFRGVETINFRQQIVKLDEKLNGRISYKDMLDYIILPKTIYSNSLSLSTGLENTGDMSAQPKLTYVYKASKDVKNDTILKSSVLLVKKASKDVITPLDLTNVDMKHDLDINLSITGSSDKTIVEDKIIIKFLPMRYLPIINIVVIIVIIDIIGGIYFKRRRKEKKGKEVKNV